MAAQPSVLVTGGAGFIGSHLVERLLAQGRRVIVIDDLSTGSLQNLETVRDHPQLTVHACPVSSCPQLDATVAACESVYHLAAAVGVDKVLASPLRAMQINLRETERILQSASLAHVPVLLASSSEVYGKSDKEAFSEEDDLLIGTPTQARWSYACSKLMDEFLALACSREQQLPVIIARLFNTVGPRQSGRYGMVLPRFIQAAKSGEPVRVFGDGQQTRCFCDVGDAVEALLRLQGAAGARGGIVNVGSTEEISIEALARLVIETVGSTSVVEHVRYEEAYAAGFEDLRRRKPKVERLRALTGFVPSTPLRRIIERTAATKPELRRVELESPGT
jgi:UDP-glucose 4-epimerase